MAIGLDIPRADGLDKLSGRARYVDDIAMPGMLHGGTVRSAVSRGRIRRIEFDPNVNWGDFVVVDHRDIPAGRNAIKLIEADQPALAADIVRHKYEPILLIAHRSPAKVREALRAIRVEIDPLPAVLDPRAPLSPELTQHGDDNVFKRIDIRRGAGTDAAELARVFASAAHVVKREYRTGSQEHVYIEPQGMLAYRENGRLVVMGSTQCPYYVLDSLCYLFGRPREAFRVVQTVVGGGFGGKEDYPSVVAVHAALLAEKAGAPVKIVYDRHEDMAATTKRHPAIVRHETAVDHDGRLLAMKIDVLMDGGAYVTLSPVVLSRGAIHAVGPYACEHVHVHAEARLTNSPPNGAFRGFGAPQTLFAVERHMDEIARTVGRDPADVRRINLLRDGQPMGTGQIYRDGPELPALLDRALHESGYHAKRAQHANFNAAHSYLRRGIGIATFHHGSGFTGSGETYLASEVHIEALPDGTIEVQTAQTDMGQGTSTILSQIAAEALCIPLEFVRTATPDTSRVPNSGPTVASRTAMVVGRLIERACADLRSRLAGLSDARDATTHVAGADARNPQSPIHNPQSTRNSKSEIGYAPSPIQDPRSKIQNPLGEAVLAWHAAHPGQRLLGRAKYERPAEIQWDDKTYLGDAYAAYSWSAYVAEIEIDLRTYATRVIDFVAVQDVGRVLNPTLARGQIQGGVAQAIGWALYEDVVLDGGAMKNNQMTNYIIPACGDLPPIRVFFIEHPSQYGPGGAKGLGEMPIDGPAPAVLNAVAAALNCSPREIPLTPERLLRLLETDTKTQGHKEEKNADE